MAPAPETTEARPLGPIRVWGPDDVGTASASVEEGEPSAPVSALATLLSLAHDERILLTLNAGGDENEVLESNADAGAASLVLTDRALYSTPRLELAASSTADTGDAPRRRRSSSASGVGATSGGGFGGWLRGLLTSVAARAPLAEGAERQGVQQWRHGANIISRLDLTLVESVGIVEAPGGGGGPPHLVLYAPRSAIPTAYAAAFAMRSAGGGRRSSRRESAAVSAVEADEKARSLRAALCYLVGRGESCQMWNVAVRHATQRRWQALLEAGCLAEPEVYQAHTRAKELASAPSRVAPQSRLLVLSDRRVHSVHREGMRFGSTAWSADIHSLQTVEQLALQDRKVAGYPYTLVLHWKSSRSPSATFAVKEREDLLAMSACLQQVHQRLTGESLPVKALHHGGA